MQHCAKAAALSQLQLSGLSCERTLKNGAPLFPLINLLSFPPIPYLTLSSGSVKKLHKFHSVLGPPGMWCCMENKTLIPLVGYEQLPSGTLWTAKLLGSTSKGVICSLCLWLVDHFPLARWGGLSRSRAATALALLSSEKFCCSH